MCNHAFGGMVQHVTAIKTFLISLLISLSSGKHKQHGTNEDYLMFSNYLDTLEMFQT